MRLLNNGVQTFLGGLAIAGLLVLFALGLHGCPTPVHSMVIEGKEKVTFRVVDKGISKTDGERWVQLVPYIKVSIIGRVVDGKPDINEVLSCEEDTKPEKNTAMYLICREVYNKSDSRLGVANIVWNSTR